MLVRFNKILTQMGSLSLICLKIYTKAPKAKAKVDRSASGRCRDLCGRPLSSNKRHCTEMLMVMIFNNIVFGNEFFCNRI